LLREDTADRDSAERMARAAADHGLSLCLTPQITYADDVSGHPSRKDDEV
jgi:hypothetical protein